MRKMPLWWGRFVPLASLLLFMSLMPSSVPASVESSLSEQVTIRRDTYGIPHILAKTEEAAAFGFGYAQAEDHCLEIARALFSGRGEEAKTFGTGAEGDFIVNLYDVSQMAKQDLDRVSPVYRKIVSAFAAGVNRYVAQHRQELPDWIPAFTGVDVMASRRAGAVRSAFSQTTVRALQRKYPESGPPSQEAPNKEYVELPDADRLSDPSQSQWDPIELPGSNAFALSGSRTTSGKPILLGNPHLNWSSLYWEAQVTVPGKIVYRTAAKAFAIDSTQIDAFRYYEGFYALSKARNLKEFMSIMKQNMVPTSNFTYADAEGNILYLWNARIPKRVDDGTDYRLDVPADTAKYVWRKLLKVEEFPRLLNPRGGYMMNCNNPPWYTSLSDPVDPKKYPAYLEEERGLALRPQAALEMISGNEKFSFDDIPRLKYNTKMLLADRVKPDLLRAIEQAPNPSEDLKRGLDVLRQWDNQVSAGSRGGVLFQHFWDTYAAATPQPYATAWDPNNPANTPSGLSDFTLAVRHFEEAVRWTRRTYGSEDVAWGEVHRFRFSTLDLPGDGADSTYGLFRVVRFIQMPDGKQVAGQIRGDEPPVGFGDAWVIAVEFTKPVKAWSVLAYGESTRSASRHSSDQIQIFANHQLRPIWFTEAEIRANLERAYRP